MVAGLWIWSALIASGYVIWQAQDNAYWTSITDAPQIAVRLGMTFISASLVVFFMSYVIFRSWRNLPTSWRMRFWFGLVSVVMGILWFSFLFCQSMLAGQIYSLASALLLLLLWSAIFLTGLLFLYSLRHFFRWLFSWRILKRGLLAGGLFAVLAALFYAEENWRGRRAWDHYKRDLEAKGEKFDFNSFIPPTVPDEQNFAMAPVVVTSYTGKLNRPRNEDSPLPVTVTNRLLMDLQRRNYFFNTNVTIGSWQTARLTDLKRWQDYYRTRFVTNDMMSEPPPMPGMPVPAQMDTNIYYNVAVPLDTNDFPMAAQPQTPALDVLLALSKYDRVLEELQQAGERPYSRFPINLHPENPDEFHFPHFQGLKQCATVLQLRAIAKVQPGQTEPVLTDVKLILRLAESIRSEPFLVSQMTRTYLVSIMMQPIWEGLAEKRWSDAELKMLIQELQKLDFISDLQFGMQAEQASELGTIQYWKTHRDANALWLLLAISPKTIEMLEQVDRILPDMPAAPNELLDTLGKFLPEEPLNRMMMHLPPDGWYDQNKVALGRIFQAKLFPLANPDKHLISWQAATETMVWMEKEHDWRKLNPQNVLIHTLFPAVSRAALRFALVQNSVDMAILACALERYHLAQGEYPETLAALMPSFLEKIPPDVVDGQPLHYHRMSDGRFRLYSIGWNGKDDGGVVGLNIAGRVNPQLGDWVWQYSARP
jgi:hypothetical protein